MFLGVYYCSQTVVKVLFFLQLTAIYTFSIYCICTHSIQTLADTVYMLPMADIVNRFSGHNYKYGTTDIKLYFICLIIAT